VEGQDPFDLLKNCGFFSERDLQLLVYICKLRKTLNLIKDLESFTLLFLVNDIKITNC